MSNDSVPAGPASTEPIPQLTLEIKEEYLQAHVTGQRTWAAVSALVTEIAQAAIEHKRDRVLVDVRELQGWLGGLSSYQVVTQDFQRFRGKGIVKVAIVDRPLPNLRGWFLEMVARNRGFNLKIFESPQVALDWLMGPKTGAENSSNKDEKR